jgi:parvulin-like peptidyl-prolyl isomerase
MIRGQGYWLSLLAGVAMGWNTGGLRAQEVPPGKPAAVVNGVAIPVAEVKSIVDKYDEQNRSPTPMPKSQRMELWKDALNMLIEDELMRQFLRKNAPAVTPAEVNKELADLDEALRRQGKTRAQFFAETHQTEGQIRADIVAKHQFQNYMRAQVPDAMIKKYYDENKVFFDKVFVKASHILIKLKPDASAAERETARSKLLSFRQEVLAGRAKFADLARKYSDCPSKKDGGDIGMFPYKFVVKEPFARAAFSMKVGQISDVVTTDVGLHLILVTDRTKGEPSRFEDIKELVRDTCVREMEIVPNILAEQRRAANIEIFLK